MDVAYTSSRALYNVNRLNILRLQSQLSVAQDELATGRLTDVGETLGGRTAETVSLRQQFGRFTTLIETNGIAKTRLDSAQTTLDDMMSVGEEFINTLIASRDAEGGATAAQQKAEASLIALIDQLNTTIAGEQLFAGINTTVAPISDYYSTPTSASRTAVENAFTTAFGTTQSDPSNDGITPADMQTFLDNGFAALFDAPDWGTAWSSASDQTITSRISGSENVQTSASANEPAFRKLAEAYTMIADLGVENLNRGTFGTVVDQAIRLTGEALQDLSGIQARLGTSAARIEVSNDKMRAQRNILNTQIDNLEKVDPFEASTRVTTLLTQLEMSFALTARVQQLTLMNYLPV